jgi:hypothetical protein
VDPGLHHLQGKARLVNATELLDLLHEFYREKLALRHAHVASARVVEDYNFNNTYQYVIAREDVQLNWLRDAIAGLGREVSDGAEPDAGPQPKGSRAQASAIERDGQAAQAFANKWRPRIEAMPNARHRTMLGVILGETLEHKRFFEQAAAGRPDLLGRRPEGAGTGGGVLPVRWIERRGD